MKDTFKKLGAWLGWIVALLLAIMQFVEDNPIPTDDVDTVTTMVLRTLGMG